MTWLIQRRASRQNLLLCFLTTNNNASSQCKYHRTSYQCCASALFVNFFCAFLKIYFILYVLLWLYGQIIYVLFEISDLMQLIRTKRMFPHFKDACCGLKQYISMNVCSLSYINCVRKICVVKTEILILCFWGENSSWEFLTAMSLQYLNHNLCCQNWFCHVIILKYIFV